MGWVVLIFGAGAWFLYSSSQPPDLDTLTDCVNSTEQIRLLRELNLAPKGKEMIAFCRQTFPNNEFCDGQYLNAEVPVRDCMKKAGYGFTFGPTCSYVNWRSNNVCYHKAWVLRLEALTDEWLKKIAKK